MYRSIRESRVLCVAVGVMVAFAGRAWAGNITGSSIQISGDANPIEAVTVTLHQLKTTNPSDLDVVVVGPTGAALVLMGGAGGTSQTGPIDVTFDDTAASNLISGPLTTGTFKPTQVAPIGAFPSPGPGLAYTSPAPAGAGILGNANAAGVFGGTSASTALANGTWSLFAMDTVSGDSTNIAGGWSLNINQPFSTAATFTNSTPLVLPTVPEPGTLTLALLGISGMAGRRMRRRQ